MKRFFVAILVTGMSVSLSGCLGDSKDGASDPPGNGVGDGAGGAVNVVAALQKASQRTARVATLKADMTVSSKTPQGSVEMHMTAQMRLRPRAAMRMVMDPLKLDGRSIPGATAKTQLVQVGNVLYMRSAALSKRAGKPWVKIPASGLGKGGQNLDTLAQNRDQMDPAGQTRMFTAATNARQVGKEQIDGVQTTHYTGSMTPAEAIAKLDPADRKNRQKALRTLGAKTLAFDLWVDAQQLPRKMVVRIDGTNPVTTTMLYRDYGKPVAIAAPPPGQVATLPRLPRSGGPAGI